MILEFKDDDVEQAQDVIWDLVLARAKLKAVCATMKDDGDENTAEIISEVDVSVFSAVDFLNNALVKNEDE